MTKSQVMKEMTVRLKKHQLAGKIKLKENLD